MGKKQARLLKQNGVPKTNSCVFCVFLHMVHVGVKQEINLVTEQKKKLFIRLYMYVMTFSNFYRPNNLKESTKQGHN